MSVSINKACISCGACIWECPNSAIAPGDPRPTVHTERCTECYGFFGESQCMVVCPAEAIVVAEEPVALLRQRFQTLHPGRHAQNTWIWQSSPPVVE
ncbi:4Fe-4S binding protein [Streptomyces durhamensis]|uniref:4Fe-4S binding protein n=1 Tax=Streptomyces durhamensis TaxID=68194 RepID=UPI00099C5F37